MTRSGKATSWVGLKEVLLHGVQSVRHGPPPQLTGVPSSWVSAWDYWVQGVRKPRERDEKTVTIALKSHQPKKETPPEAWYTTEEVVADIQAIFTQTIVPIKIADMLAADQQELNMGEISEEELAYRTERLEEIQEEHYVRLEGIIQWYVDSYFRELPVAEPQEKSIH
ncbi:MAG: hypothetical protein HQM06_14545 [Magnetococcales bacterium]|nr:hypothetical protein [Magnetococcales bacterium]